jgi:hypothetical protein
MGSIREILIENVKEYYRNALLAETKKEYNTAVTLYFKAISALCDLYILAKEGKIPSNHTERFRILEQKYKEIYKIIDKDFPFYQDSYKARLTKEVSSMLKDDTRKLSEVLGIRI